MSENEKFSDIEMARSTKSFETAKLCGLLHQWHRASVALQAFGMETVWLLLQHRRRMAQRKLTV